MATRIKLKRSSTASAAPTTSTLLDGEVAVNTADKKIYVRDGSNIVEVANAEPAVGEITTAMLNADITNGQGKTFYVATVGSDNDLLGNGGNNGTSDLGLLTDEGVPLSARQSYNSRFIYSHTSTSDSNAQNTKQMAQGIGNYKYSFAVVRIFSPFEVDKKTTVLNMHFGYSSTSVVASVPTYGIAYEPSRVTGISIIPEYSLGNAGTLRVYGVA